MVFNNINRLSLHNTHSQAPSPISRPCRSVAAPETRRHDYCAINKTTGSRQRLCDLIAGSTQHRHLLYAGKEHLPLPAQDNFWPFKVISLTQFYTSGNTILHLSFVFSDVQLESLQRNRKRRCGHLCLHL